jgi:hypothetical protein
MPAQPEGLLAMPAAKTPEAREYPVRGHFRRKERNSRGIDVSVSYDPAGKDGWPGAKAVFVGVPGSDEVQALFDNPDGPLLWEIPEETPASGSAGKES